MMMMISSLLPLAKTDIKEPNEIAEKEAKKKKQHA